MLDCELSSAFSLGRAGRWFLQSGIQNPRGGVARFYHADLQKNKPVSTEITGYTASTLVYLYRATGEQEYLDRARLTAVFLRDTAWNPKLAIFPFENPSPTEESPHRAYFFDSGIIIRGLIAVWRETQDDSLIELCRLAARGMLKDFATGRDGEFFPILSLPDKLPLEPARYWSGSAGCYQAKSALAWRELAEITGDASLREAFLQCLNAGLRTYRDFLPGTDVRTGIMDRLHAFTYFLEALWPLLTCEDCCAAYQFGLGEIGRHLREIAPEFARSDVYAQLLRARLLGSGAVPLDVAAAREEASALVGFQIVSDDPRLDGGFRFGDRAGAPVPHANPVSTAFAIQALHLWDAYNRGENNPCRMPPI
jgi:hypothetical protein